MLRLENEQVEFHYSCEQSEESASHIEWRSSCTNKVFQSNAEVFPIQIKYIFIDATVPGKFRTHKTTLDENPFS